MTASMLSGTTPTTIADVKHSMKPRTTQDKILARYAREFDALKAELMQLGFFCKGTVLHRTLKCGRPTCPCAHDPAQRHGPYFEWPYKVGGKTVNHRLGPEEAKIYREGSRQYHEAKRLLQRMETLSRRTLERQARLAKG